MFKTIIALCLMAIVAGCYRYPSAWQHHRYEQRIYNQQRFDDFMTRTTGPQGTSHTNCVNAVNIC